MRVFAPVLSVALLASSSGPSAAAQAAQQPGEQIYIATGEYDCKRDWDAVIRLDDARAGLQPAAATVPVKRLTDDNEVTMNFVHNIFVHPERDELYAAAIFTGLDYPAATGSDCSIYTDFPAIQAGSVGVIEHISSADGPQRLARHLFGDQTGLQQPHGVFVDKSREMLYVANGYGGNILVWHDAYRVDGNTPPDRVISSPLLRYAAHVFVDPATDVLFVGNFAGLRQPPGPTPDDGTRSAVLIFDNASQLDGSVLPTARIVDDGAPPDETRLTQGSVHITHTVWYDPPSKLLFVVHHTNEVPIYDVSDMGQKCAPDFLHCELAPKAVISVGSNNTDEEFSSVYGVFYEPRADRLYLSVGYTVHEEEYVVGGYPENGIYVYDGVSRFRGGPTAFAPSRVIGWDGAVNPHLDPVIGIPDVYLPAQPIWVVAN
jgi:hypothetical protein